MNFLQLSSDTHDKINKAMNLIDKLTVSPHLAQEVVRDALSNVVKQSSLSVNNAFAIIDDIYRIQTIAKFPVSFSHGTRFVQKSSNEAMYFFMIPDDIQLNFEEITRNNQFLSNISVVKHHP